MSNSTWLGRETGPGVVWRVQVLFCAAVLTCIAACTGGELLYTPPSASSPGAVGLPIEVTAPVAPPDYRTTPEQAATWSQKQKSGDTFNDLLVQSTVVKVDEHQSEQVRLDGSKLCFPKGGNAALLQLKPGATLLGKPAPAHLRRSSGGSNNVLGFARKVKSVYEQNGEIVVETEPAGLADVVVGAANLQFPSDAKPLDIGSEVDIYKILPDLPPPLQVTPVDGNGEFATRNGPLTWLDTDLKVGVGFGGTYSNDLMNIKESVGPLDVVAIGKLMIKANFEAAARLAVTVESTWSNPVPHLEYFFAGASIAASLDALLDAYVKLTYTKVVGAGDVEKDEQKAKKALADTPLAKQIGGVGSLIGNQTGQEGEFTIGDTKYYEGPIIAGIPTTFAFNIVGKCKVIIYGEMDATASGHVAFGADFGVEYKGGNWGVVAGSEFEKKYQFELRKFGGGATLQCAVGPRLDWLFAGVGGPFISPKLGLRAGGKYESVCPEPGKIPNEIKAKGKASAFVDIGVVGTLGVGVDLKVTAISYSKDLVENWWTLWDDSWVIDPGLGTCPTHCNNGKQDDYETAADCGGKSAGGGCLPCGYQKSCKANADCNFGDKLTCQGGTCNNLNCQTGQQEAYMTDTNCGGLCASAGWVCGVGKKCKENADCESNNCAFGKCDVQKCDNGQRDWWETDVDCGGKYCGPCDPGHLCKNDGDCKNGLVCRGNWTATAPYFATGACVPASCDLDKWWTMTGWGQKADQTDAMCGGTCARVVDYLPPEACNFGKDDLLVDKACGLATVKCAKSKKCEQDGDCLSNACWQGQCVELANNDGKQQPWESDADCGGKNPYKCKIDQGCFSSVDCQYSAPCVKADVGSGKVCALCDKNGKLDGWEADVDCGAQCAGGKAAFELCKLGQKCLSSADCATGYQATFQGQAVTVDAVSCTLGTCQLTCFNGQWDAKVEADTDCGGKCALKCGEGKQCKSGDDCDSGGCLGGKCASKCFNAKHDAGEGGIDCAGTCSAKCLKGMGCSQDSDCTTGQCIKNVCGVDTCKDSKLSPGESDVDCGGPCTKKCAVKAACKADKDCDSGYCNGAVCVATGCEDLKKTSGEADIDCGGVCAPGLICGVGKLCKQGGDCQSGICSKLGKCVDSLCKDGAMSAGETDVDCGGACGNKCTTGKGCKGGGDCDSGYCDGAVCVGDFCSDKVLSSGESDVDCGGGCQNKCSSGKKCSGGGDCASGFCTPQGTCASGACEDGKKSPGEADVDCGGKCGTPCLVSKACLGNGDCASGLCAAVSLYCVATTCQDELKDAGETDLDCGGGCKACALNKGCAADSDCQSGWCDGQKCVATHCSDNKKDADETDVDCGGECGSTCGTTKACAGDSDCQSGFCDAQGKACVDSPCLDHHLDKGETDVDCGGICQSSKACDLKQGCAAGADCASGVCAVAGTCVVTTCFDGKVSPDESGLDCGGACSQKCTAGQGCKQNQDCDSSFCSAKGLCVGGACQDGKLSPGETDIDCGGPCQQKCDVAQGCLADGDCLAGWCDGQACQATSCTDKKKDATETDVDCGGPCSQKCAVKASCALGSDCASGVCAVKSLLCVATTCTDEQKSGNETDLDCGGSCSQKCLSQKGCAANSDCQSGYCDGSVCVDDPCVDKQKDQGESDLDCGSVCSQKCATGQGCGLPGDCTSGFCDGSQCVASACLDKKEDFGETDVDCGGSCAPCAAGLGCSGPGDCASSLCAVVSAVCVTSTCADEVKSGDETDVDCGGGCGQKCVTGNGCSKNSDCASGYCDGTVCVADHCLDKQTDAGETGPDCGGSCEQACDNGQGCKLATDCTSTYCAAISLACVPTPCADEVKNGAETDVDCGGATCSGKCAVDKGCSTGSDCQTGYCNPKTGKCVADHCSDTLKDGGEVGVDCGGSCSAKCKDGDSCTVDGDCEAGVCSSMSNGSPPLQCGCPPFTKLTKINSAKKQAVCAQNYVYPTGCSQGSTPGVLECQPYQITQQVYFPNDGITSQQIMSVCDAVTAGGYDDWRTPTLPELVSLLQFKKQSESAPAAFNAPVQLLYPPNTWDKAPFYVSATTINPPYQGYTSNAAGNLGANTVVGIDTWGGSFIRPAYSAWTNPINLGAGDIRSAQTFCVRRQYDWPPTLTNPRFQVTDGGQVVRDNHFNRSWFRTKYYKINDWVSAQQWCQGIGVGGGGWRLPTMYELLQIIDWGKSGPPYWDTDMFPDVDGPSTANGYWPESFVTSDQLCNDVVLNPCRYAFTPYDLRMGWGGTLSAICVR